MAGLYLLRFLFNGFSLVVFFLHVSISLYVINLDIYEEFMFELSLYLDILDNIPYLNSEVMYVLSLIHILFLINLKKFETFWAIIDKKLLRD